jgi:hypothetical protein
MCRTDETPIIQLFVCNMHETFLCLAPKKLRFRQAWGRSACKQGLNVHCCHVDLIDLHKSN